MPSRNDDKSTDTEDSILEHGIVSLTLPLKLLMIIFAEVAVSIISYSTVIKPVVGFGEQAIMTFVFLNKLTALIC